MESIKNIYNTPDKSREDELSGTQLASFYRRFIALVIDFIVAGLIFVVISIIYILISEWTGLLKPNSDETIRFGFYENWYSIIWLVIYFTLSFYFGNGQSLGKKICKIRVVSIVHKRLGLWHSFERALGYGASALELGFGFFQYFIRKDRRTIHDRIAETIVINEIKKE